MSVRNVPIYLVLLAAYSLLHAQTGSSVLKLENGGQQVTVLADALKSMAHKTVTVHNPHTLQMKHILVCR